MHGIAIEEALWGLLPLCLMLLGVIVLWWVSWQRQHRSYASARSRTSVRWAFVGWLILLLGSVGTIVSTAMFFSPVVLVIAVVVLIAGSVRYWQSEAHYLLWSLAEAAQRGIPLEQAARALADERGGALAASVQNLAAYLEAAMPLSVALARSNLWTSPELRLAADVGEKTGTLGPSLQRALDRSAVFDHTFAWIWVRFLYIASLVLVLMGVLSFLMLKIVPVFVQIFQEFGTPLPAATQMLIRASTFVAQFWFLLVPFLLVLAGGAIVGMLIFVGVPAQSLPVVRSLVAPIDNATVLHSLGTAVLQRQSVSGTLHLLSGLTRSQRSRRRLNAALERMEEGVHWSDALEQAGLASRAQGAVIKSAERAGNLAWALNEMADSTIRRAAQRAQAVLSLVFPLCIVGFAMCVLFVAVGILSALFSLIEALA